MNNTKINDISHIQVIGYNVMIAELRNKYDIETSKHRSAASMNFLFAQKKSDLHKDIENINIEKDIKDFLLDSKYTDIHNAIIICLRAKNISYHEQEYEEFSKALQYILEISISKSNYNPFELYSSDLNTIYLKSRFSLEIIKWIQSLIAITEDAPNPNLISKLKTELYEKYSND